MKQSNTLKAFCAVYDQDKTGEAFDRLQDFGSFFAESEREARTHIRNELIKALGSVTGNLDDYYELIEFSDARREEEIDKAFEMYWHDCGGIGDISEFLDNFNVDCGWNEAPLVSEQELRARIDDARAEKETYDYLRGVR